MADHYQEDEMTDREQHDADFDSWVAEVQEAQGGPIFRATPMSPEDELRFFELGHFQYLLREEI